MTTMVTVTTPPDRKARVSRIHPETGDTNLGDEVVPAGAQVVFYVHSEQGILITEEENDDD